MRQQHEICSFIIVIGLVVAAGHAAVRAAEDSPSKQPNANAPGKVVAAKVNGEPIYEEQVNAAMDQHWVQSKISRLQKENPGAVKQLRLNALNTLIDDELIVQEGRKLKIDDLDKKMAQKVKELEARFGAGEGLKKYMKRKSLTEEGFKQAVETRVRIEEYLKRRRISDPEVPEDRIRKMYDERPNMFFRQERIKVSHILIAADAHAGAEAQQQARQKAEKIRAEIVQGKDFSEMAKKYSTCNSASGGGDLGSIGKGYMPKEFDQVAFALDKGAISEVVKTKFGYHIIKVSEKEPAGVTPYAEVRDFLRKYLQEEESKQRLAAQLVELRKQSKLEILLK